MKKSLTRRERLRNTGDIKSLFKTGKRVDDHGVKLFFDANGSPSSRMTVVVGRGCGGAVRRNREKRITREAYRNVKPDLKSGNDIIVFIGRFGQSFSQRQASLLGLLQRADLFRTLQ